MKPPLIFDKIKPWGLWIVLGVMLVAGISFPVSSRHEETITMAFIENQDQDPLFKVAEIVYAEAFRRLGLSFAYQIYPNKRCGFMSNQGYVDGKPGRVGNYAQSYPNLIRVEVPLFTKKTAAFAKNPSLSLSGWDSLKNTPYRVEYPRTSVNTEKELSRRVPADRLFDIESIEQALKKLLMDRTDVFIATEEMVIRVLEKAPFKNAGIFSVGVMDEITLYSFLHKKHAPLAPKLADVLTKMKAEGWFEQCLTTGKPTGDEVP